MTNDNQPKNPPERWGASTVRFYADMEGEIVNAHLLNGELLSGELVGVDRYDVFLHREDKTILVPKHAVAWMERAGG